MKIHTVHMIFYGFDIEVDSSIILSAISGLALISTRTFRSSDGRYLLRSKLSGKGSDPPILEVPSFGTVGNDECLVAYRSARLKPNVHAKGIIHMEKPPGDCFDSRLAPAFLRYIKRIFCFSKMALRICLRYVLTVSPAKGSLP